MHVAARRYLGENNEELAPMLGHPHSHQPQSSTALNTKRQQLHPRATITPGLNLSTAPEGQCTQHCPNCVVNVVDSATAQTGERPSVVAGALAAHPGVNYILPAYESTVEPSGALEGATTAGLQDKLKAGMATGTGSGIQRIIDGKFVYVNVLPNTYQEAWATTDQAVRLLMGNEPVKDPLVQLRVFSKENVQGMDISKAAFQKSTMFGPNTFEAVYEKLWGIK